MRLNSACIAIACAIGAGAQTAAAPALADLVKKPYLELIAMAGSLDYPKKTIDDYRKQLETQKKEDIDGLEAEKKSLKVEEDDVRRQLDELNRSASVDDKEMAAKRMSLHCKLWQVDRDLRETKTERSISIPVAYDHKLTKLDIVAQWPAKKREV